MISTSFSLYVNATPEYSNYWGGGIGISYSGIGLSYGVKTDRDIKFASIGCIDYSSQYGATCGGGIGWTTTELFPQKANHHGFGVYVGLIGSQLEADNKLTIDRKSVYGGSLGYHYFLNGIGAKGLTLGASVAYGSRKNDNDFLYNFSIGYIF
jgi:hypothetical protein|tara:strand:- start:879 stop:1337 length:459 start_codon:yes stop_codon:yes gene_type:complete